jgi:hypothetical protein
LGQNCIFIDVAKQKEIAKLFANKNVKKRQLSLKKMAKFLM